ncbi:hypothetical protein [Micromonospora sp. WMMD1082]|uniref:hypothetical protein n=1 Tax=Micromonospora sp. WMMD1082 TaxID=3016104 RepID=UPI0024167B71|nr:hypothetical protein [Micromonospora sp. WMMD1082]MDG4794467.1 hypothetical protein [Micromonospora sp. WMMD1082]
MMPYHPSGLFPSGRPPRPTYREPNPVGGGGVAAGAAGTLAWLVLFGLLGRGFAEYAWWTLLAGALAWLVALVLVRYGDRGVAAGIAIVTAGGWSIAAAAIVTRWVTSGDWPLW